MVKRCHDKYIIQLCPRCSDCEDGRRKTNEGWGGGPLLSPSPSLFSILLLRVPLHYLDQAAFYCFIGSRYWTCKLKRCQLRPKIKEGKKQDYTKPLESLIEKRSSCILSTVVDHQGVFSFFWQCPQNDHRNDCQAISCSSLLKISGKSVSVVVVMNLLSLPSPEHVTCLSWMLP